MTYIAPEYSNLRESTLKLKDRFNVLFEKYQISDEKGSHPLTILYNRTADVVSCDTDRKTVQDTFKKLRDDLRPVLESDDEDLKEKAAQFLLGALLHRYFRLLKEMADWNFVPSLFSVTLYKPKQCRLFQSIRKALGFLHADYKLDLQYLDTPTVVSSLQVFKENMILHDRYLEFEHFKKDINFFSYLEDIIKEQYSRLPSVFHQLAAIDFVQSLVKQLDIEKLEVEQKLKEWVSQLSKMYKDISKLDIETIRKHLDVSVEDGHVKLTILKIVNSPFIQDGLESQEIKTYEHFEENMLNWNRDRLVYTLVGAYVLLLQSKNIYGVLGEKDNLPRLILDGCLDLDKWSSLDLSDRLRSVELFQVEFLEIKDNPDLNVTFFGSIAKLKAITSQYRVRLGEEIEQQALAQQATIKLA